MPSAYLQWRFHSGERVVARGPLVSYYHIFFFLYIEIPVFNANSVDPDQMPHCAMSNLDLHCLPNYPFGCLQTKLVNKKTYVF